MRTFIAASALVLGLASPALAQQATATATSPAIAITGAVSGICSVGPSLDGGNVFQMNTIIDTTTGFLLPSLATESKTLGASFCNGASTITVAASPMTAQSFVGPAPEGFSNAVNYTASASGWTTNPAVFNTGLPANPGASQSQDSHRTADIVVQLAGFSTVGGDELRIIADPVYQGSITVTLTAAN